jgi:hypothetical protein
MTMNSTSGVRKRLRVAFDIKIQPVTFPLISLKYEKCLDMKFKSLQQDIHDTFCHGCHHWRH